MRYRRLAIFLAVLAVFAAATLGVGWHIAARVLAGGIERWAAERRAEGYRVGYDSPRIDGFPFTLEVRIEHPTVEAPQGAWRWAGPPIEGRAALWRPLHVHTDFAGSHALVVSQTDGTRLLRIDAANAEGDIDLRADGRVERADLLLADLLVHESGATTRVARAELHARLPHPPNPDHRQSTLSFDLALDGLSLSPDLRPALGTEVTRLEAAGDVMGEIETGKPAEVFAAWRDAGGVIELRRLSAQWGPLDVAGDGTLALDAAMQPLAAMSVRLRGFSESLKALVAGGYVRPRDGNLAAAMLGALAKPPPEGGRPELKVALTMQNGFLFAGPIKLLPLPKLEWQ